VRIRGRLDLIRSRLGKSWQGQMSRPRCSRATAPISVWSLRSFSFIEFVGGICIALGLLPASSRRRSRSRWAISPSITLGQRFLLAHRGYEYTLLWGNGDAGDRAARGGPWSLDRKLGRSFDTPLQPNKQISSGRLT